jgi:hypothetical protein
MLALHREGGHMARSQDSEVGRKQVKSPMGFGVPYLLTSVMDRAFDSNGFGRKVWDGSALDDGMHAGRSVRVLASE